MSARAAARQARAIYAEAVGVESEVARTGSVSLGGSAALVTETVMLCVGKILRAREVYADEAFSHIEKFGVNGVVCHAPGVRPYLQMVASRVHACLLAGELERVVLVIGDVGTRRVVERWTFRVDVDGGEGEGMDVVDNADEVDEEERGRREEMYRKVARGMETVAGQLEILMTAMEEVEDECSFEVLLYAKKGAVGLGGLGGGEGWETVRPDVVVGGVEQKAFAFSTSRHAVAATVACAGD